MTTEELRWCTIDGSTWKTSVGTMQFTIFLAEVNATTHVYQVFMNELDNQGTRYLGAYDTLASAKKACMEIIK